MKKTALLFAGTFLLIASSKAGVRVYVEDAAGVALIKYECTAGEVVRAFALDVTVDRGQIVNISDYFVGPSTGAARGYGIFPAAFRDHITVTSNTVVNWNASGYNPLAVVADDPGGTLPGLGTSGVTLEFGALWDPALPEAAPPSSGTLCALQLSEGAMVTVAANASRGGVVLSPDGNSVAPTFTGAIVGPLPEIAVEQEGTHLANGGSTDFGPAAIGSNVSLTFTIKNTGNANLTGLGITKGGTHPDEFTVMSDPIAPVGGPGGTTNFTLRFTPIAAGLREASIQIASNDVNDDPFNITLRGTGITAYQAWATAAGLPAGQSDPLLAPHDDGVSNLLKFAFNMDPTRPDVRMLSVGGEGTSGLPGGAMEGGVFRLEFLRRKAGSYPGITYTPQFGSAPDSWTDFSGTESVSPLDPESPTWERVVVDDPAPGPGPRFGRLKVVQTP
jgi:hypothetical protein